MSLPQSQLAGVLAIVATSLLWGTTGTAASFAPEVTALAIAAFATGVGGLLMVFSAKKTLRYYYASLIMHPQLLWIGAAAVAVYPLAFYSSMRMAGVAIGTVVSIASAPCFAVLLEWGLGEKKLSMSWLRSFALGALGIVLLTFAKRPEHSELAVGGDQDAGIILGLLAGFCYALYSFIAKQLLGHNIGTRAVMASLFGIASILLLPSLFFTGKHLFASFSNIGIAVYMAVLPIFLGYLLFGYGLKFIDASLATLITLLEPVVATILAIIVVGERFSMMGWIGISLIIICLFEQCVRKPSPQY